MTRDRAGRDRTEPFIRRSHEGDRSVPSRRHVLKTVLKAVLGLGLLPPALRPTVLRAAA